MKHIPFFSIGLVTYDRPLMLIEAIKSVLNQTFDDYELIIGNDNPEKTISASTVGIDDPRLVFVNNTRNVGEINNLNLVLEKARGRYFTWLGDDDAYFPTFFESVHKSLEEFGPLPCVFTSYYAGSHYPRDAEITIVADGKLFEGRKFLSQYLERNIRLQGCYGVFDKECIKKMGGMEELNPGFSPGSDQLLAIRCGSLERVIYIDAPLIFYRTHPGSLSLTSPDIDAYRNSQIKIFREACDIFKKEGAIQEAQLNAFLLLLWHLDDYLHVMNRSGRLQWAKLIRYISYVLIQSRRLGKNRNRIVHVLSRKVLFLLVHENMIGNRSLPRRFAKHIWSPETMDRLKSYLRKQM